MRRRSLVATAARCAGIVFATALLAAGAAACQQQSMIQPGPLPGASPTALASMPQDVEYVDVKVQNGKFTEDRYDVQKSEIRMTVLADGGPYVLAIDSLVGPQPLSADAETVVAFTAPAAGEYTMTLRGPDGTETDTAVLNVHRPGFE